MWRKQARMGMIPYYMFVDRDTEIRRYFELPLERTWHVYQNAMSQVSGLARTARGPSMSTDPGKVKIQGVTKIRSEKVFALRFIQAGNPDWVQPPFFAKFDPAATWLDPLQPVFGKDKFFFEDCVDRQGTIYNDSPSIIIRCQILNVSSTHSRRPYRSGPSSVS